MTSDGHYVPWSVFLWTFALVTGVFALIMSLYVVPELRSLREFREDQKVMSERRSWQLKGFDDDLGEMRSLVQASASKVSELAGRVSQCAAP